MYLTKKETITKVGLLFSILFCGTAYAQSAPSNTNIAGPSASATGNVTNQLYKYYKVLMPSTPTVLVYPAKVRHEYFPICYGEYEW